MSECEYCGCDTSLTVAGKCPICRPEEGVVYRSVDGQTPGLLPSAEFAGYAQKVEPRHLIGKRRRFVNVYECPHCVSGQVSKDDQHCPTCETLIDFAV